jgi:hypothetical protein
VGASVIHGRRLLKQRIRCPDGREADELIADGGGWVNMAYSSVARMVEFCTARGASEDAWPIYYGVWEGDADLADVADRCERLRQALARLGEGEGAEVTWLGLVREWLKHGGQFAVFE